jgi:hypothetical protein
MSAAATDWLRLEELVRRDPSRRGVAAFRAAGHWLGCGQLQAAAESLAAARGVAVVTGFSVHNGDAYVAETDGPPGALALAEALTLQGAKVALLSDAIGCPALRAGCDALNLRGTSLHEFPLGESCDAWVDAFLGSEVGRSLTHLMAIERVGPSHTLQSFLAQPRSGPPPREEFEREVPPEHRNVCHNMRGEPIDAITAQTHRLFELVHQRTLPITTIGIGDGGNEIGMGQFPWELLDQAIAHGPAGRVACRIATDWTVAAGVSNWGGYALAAVLGHEPFMQRWNARRERELLQALVDEAGCVDGLTRLREPTVDGLSREELAEFWTGLCRLFQAG